MAGGVSTGSGGSASWLRWLPVAVFLASIALLFRWEHGAFFKRALTVTTVDTTRRRTSPSPTPPAVHASGDGGGADGEAPATAATAAGADRGLPVGLEPWEWVQFLPAVPPTVRDNETMSPCSDAEMAEEDDLWRREGWSSTSSTPTTVTTKGTRGRRHGERDSGWGGGGGGGRRRDPSPSSLPMAKQVSLNLGPDGLKRALKGKTLRVELGGGGGSGDSGGGSGGGEGVGARPGRPEEGDAAGLLSGVNAVLNHLALLKRLGAPNHCIHVVFTAGGRALGKHPRGRRRDVNWWDYFFEPLGTAAPAGAAGAAGAAGIVREGRGGGGAGDGGWGGGEDGVGGAGKAFGGGGDEGGGGDGEKKRKQSTKKRTAKAPSVAAAVASPSSSSSSTASCPDPSEAPAVRLDDPSLRRLHDDEPGSIFPFPRGVHDDKRRGLNTTWYRDNRKRATSLAKKHLRVSRRLRCKAAKFWRENLGQDTTWDGSRPGKHKVKTKGVYHGDRNVFKPTVLGVHVSGGGGDGGGRPMEAREYFSLIDAFLDNRALDGRVLLVTDSPAAVTAMSGRYGSRLVTTSSLAHANALFVDDSGIEGGSYRQTVRDGGGGDARGVVESPDDRDGDRHRQPGEEAARARPPREYAYRADAERLLLEALLLARVDTLLKPASLLAELAVYLSRWRLHGRTLEMQHLYGYDRRRRYPKDGYAEEAPDEDEDATEKTRVRARAGAKIKEGGGGDDDGRDRDDGRDDGGGDGGGAGGDDYEAPAEGEQEEGTMARQRRNRDRLTAARESLWRRRERMELR